MKRLFVLLFLVFISIIPKLYSQPVESWKIDCNLTNVNKTTLLQIRVSMKQAPVNSQVWVNLQDFSIPDQVLTKSQDSVWQNQWIIPYSQITKEVFNIPVTITNQSGPLLSTNITVFYNNLPSQSMQGWQSVLQILFLSLLLAIATLLKRIIPFFQRFLIPNAIIAGFLGLLLGRQVLGLIPFSDDLLLNLVYHLMAVGFIALALQDKDKAHKSTAVPAGAYIVSTYLIQAILGLGLMMIIFYIFDPNIFTPMGLLLPLGYGQGPGQAFSIGSKWESLAGPTGAFRGLTGGGNIGVSIATMGFLWATFGGVIYMNILNRKKKEHQKSEPVVHKSLVEIEKKGDVPLTESIDRMTIQIFLIGIVYILSYFTLILLSWLLPQLGNFGSNLARMFWGFHFVFGTGYALLLRWIIQKLKKQKLLKRNYPNNYILHRIAGSSFDLMIAAAIAAISIKIFLANWIPIMLMSLLGGIVTLWWVQWIARKYYKDHATEYSLAMFGMLTGTIPTGMALLKEVDPGLQTPVSQDLVEGSGTALIFAVPILLLLPVAVKGYTHSQPILYWVSLGLFTLSLLLLLFIIHKTRTAGTKPKESKKKK